MTCNFCKKQGHKASECRNDPANQQQNGQQSKKKHATVWISKGPQDECDLHLGKGHTNETCADKRNPHGQNFVRKDSEPKQNVPTYKNQAYVPYCKRCNKVDHDTEGCNLPKISEQCVLVCPLCGVKGHQRNHCNNPNACHNCGKKGHSLADCKEAKHWEQRLAEHHVKVLQNPYQNVDWHHIIGSSRKHPEEIIYMNAEKKELQQDDQLKNYIREAVRGKGLNGTSAWNPYRYAWGIGLDPALATGHADFSVGAVTHGNTHPSFNGSGSDFVNNNAATPAWAAPGLKYKLGAAEDKHQQHIRELLEAEQTQVRRETVARVYRSKTIYPLANINDDILAGEKIVPATVKALKEGRKSTDGYPREGLELLQYWDEHRSMHTAAGLITNCGWTFIRDPNLMENIAKENKCICHKCESTAAYYDVTFLQIDPKIMDVRNLVDEPDWGVMLVFPCRCCFIEGYSYLGAADGMNMD